MLQLPSAKGFELGCSQTKGRKSLIGLSRLDNFGGVTSRKMKRMMATVGK